MTLTINHGIPTTPFFIIAQPKRKYEQPVFYQPDKNLIQLCDPKTKDVIMAEADEVFVVEKSEMEQAGSLCKMAYGLTGPVLYKVMLQKYPEMKDGDPIEFWLLKRL